MGRKRLPSMLGKQCKKVCRTFGPAKCEFLSVLLKSWPAGPGLLLNSACAAMQQSLLQEPLSYPLAWWHYWKSAYLITASCLSVTPGTLKLSSGLMTLLKVCICNYSFNVCQYYTFGGWYAEVLCLLIRYKNTQINGHSCNAALSGQRNRDHQSSHRVTLFWTVNLPTWQPHTVKRENLFIIIF